MKGFCLVLEPCLVLHICVRRVSFMDALVDVVVVVPNKLFTADMQRVYKNLAKHFGEEYALLVMFTMRTGVELHRVRTD